MSGLRIIGLLIGFISLIVTFTIYRGPRWKRKNFIFYGIFSLCLIIVSLNPGVLNVAAEILRLKMEQRGRILALLIGSNIILWFLLLYTKTRLDEFRYQFDLLIRKLGHEEVEDQLKTEIAGKEIMVIIPAYNEAENLKGLLDRVPDAIRGKKVGVLVIDDGSHDNTKDVVTRAGYMVAQNKINRGQGAASRLGYDILRRNNVPIGVTMDADYQHLPEEIEKVAGPVISNEYDFVIGSRILEASYESSFMRNAGVHLFTRIINFVTGLTLTDCASGFRAFNVHKLGTLDLKEEQFQSAEILVEAAKKNLRIGEVPITHVQRKHGTSKKGRDLKYGIFFAKTVFKSWWR